MSRYLAAREWAIGNWFLLALPFLFAISFLFARSVDWSRSGGMAEAVTIFDWCVSIPLLYFLCYRKKLPPRQLALRLLGLACLGIWIAARLVPAASHEILAHLSWARAAGLPFFILFELALLLAVLKLIFSGTATAEDVSQRTGAPPFIARLMLLEAEFWRGVWRLIRRR